MTVSHPFSMENSNHRRRHKRLRDFIAILALGGLVAGCDANAKNKTTDTLAPPEVAQLTVDGCAAITVQAEMVECFQKLKVQQDAEIAARTERINTKEIENDDKRKELEEINTNIEVLSKKSDEAWRELEERILEPER